MNDIFIFDVVLLFKSDLKRGQTPELPLQYSVLSIIFEPGLFISNVLAPARGRLVKHAHQVVSGWSFCLSGNVEAGKPTGLSPAGACMFRQIRGRVPSTVFIAFIFLDGISVDWTRSGARKRYQSSCRHTYSHF